MKYYIKERHNPQLGVYYVACGQMSIKKAKQAERRIYGDNYMLSFDTEQEYQAKIKSLKASGERIQGA
jgi:hypothetical protein